MVSSFSFFILLLVSCLSYFPSSLAVPKLHGRAPFRRSGGRTLSNNNLFATQTDHKTENLRCWDSTDTKYLIDTDDCHEALQEWRLLALEDGEVQTFSHRDSGRNDHVPLGKIVRSCLAKFDVDPAHKHEEDRLSFWMVYHSLNIIYEECVKHSKMAFGGFMTIGHQKGFYVTLRSPRAPRAVRSANNSTNLATNTADIFVIDISTLVARPTALEVQQEDAISTTSSKYNARRNALFSKLPPSESFRSPRRRRSDGTMSVPDSPHSPSSPLSPRCFPRQASSVPITMHDCWPVIQTMMHVDGELWSHQVFWGGPRGRPMPIQFPSPSCTIIVTTDSYASDRFSLEEVGNNVRHLINSCPDFHGGSVEVGTRSFVHVTGPGLNSMAPAGLNLTAPDESIIPTNLSTDTTATA